VAQDAVAFGFGYTVERRCISFLLFVEDTTYYMIAACSVLTCCNDLYDCHVFQMHPSMETKFNEYGFM
jgi:hypothetical protein